MTKPSDRDTIAAIATAEGDAALGVIRISGARAQEIAGKVLALPKSILPRTAILAKVGGSAGEEVIAIWYAAPKSYTGEDLVEISAHGGRVGMQRLLAAILSAGARLAERGEFTKRAFLAGRIDLTRAEAVCDIITAKSGAALASGERRLAGALYGEIEAIRSAAANMLAEIEARLDFSEEEIDPLPQTQIENDGEALVKKCRRLRETYQRGRLLKDGARIAIIGRPNVGKSSLFNKLLEEERAIVTETAGTTRDYLEETLAIDGAPLVIVDTAGLRQVEEEAEAIGVRRAEQAAETADLVLIVFDGASALSDDDRKLFAAAYDNPIACINKCDLDQKIEPAEIEANYPAPIFTSAKTGAGIEELKKRMVLNLAPSEGIDPARPAINRLRQAEALDRAAAAFEQIAAAYREGEELAAIRLRDGLDELGRITGETLPDEILNIIFDSFCIGK